MSIQASFVKNTLFNMIIFFHLCTMNMFYYLDAIKWDKIENSAEVSSFSHNALSGFLSLRLGLSAAGDGQATFKNFVYTPK